MKSPSGGHELVFPSPFYPNKSLSDGTLKSALARLGYVGRSPSYIFRQLHEFKIGVRAGSSSGLMKDTVVKLDQGDMIAIAAYLGTFKP